MKALLVAIAGSSFLFSAATPPGVPLVMQGANSNVSPLAPMALNGYSKFPHDIGSAPVYDLDGHRIGLVQKLEPDPTGKPAAIILWLPSGHIVTVEANNISYDQQQNIVTAGLTDVQLGIPSQTANH